MTRKEGGWCVWITGLPGSGKSVVSKTLLSILGKHGIPTHLLSSDALRQILTPKPTYSKAERNKVYSVLVYMAKILSENGVNVVIDATGNLRKYREEARRQIPRFTEVYLECPLEVCIQREAKRREIFNAPANIYKRALEGRASSVPGVGAPYEPPLKPELQLDSATQVPQELAEKIFETLRNRGCLST